MNYVSAVLIRSELTEPRRPRLQFAFSRTPPGPEPLTKFASHGSGKTALALYLPAVSAVASKAASDALNEPDAKLEGDAVAALDRDFSALIGEAKRSSSDDRGRLVRLLKAWSKPSSGSLQVLSSRVLETTLDPQTRSTAHRDVGPHPNVSVCLTFAASVARSRTVEPIRDVDVVLIYRGGEGPAGEDLDRLTEAMTPEVTVPSPAIVLQARRNAAARTELLTEFGALTASQVAELSGSEAKNRSALAGRWRREGRLVAVEHYGAVYYPAFQFDEEGRPRPVVESALAHLNDPNITPWQQALWFTTANGWLDGRRPVDLLVTEPEAVISAAREALREPVG
jgi:hypothetical protein